MINNSDEEIRKIIDPKNGFTLYIRKFDDASISQVSTLDSFPTPQPIPYSNEIASNVEEIKTDLTNIREQNNTVLESNQMTIESLNKKNSTLITLIYILAIGMIASIFF